VLRCEKRWIGARTVRACNVLSDQDVRSVIAAPDAPRTAAQVHRCPRLHSAMRTLPPHDPADRRRRGRPRRRTAMTSAVGMTVSVRAGPAAAAA